MTLLEGPTGAVSDAPTYTFDTNNVDTRAPRITGGKSELSGHFLGEIGGVRTEVQVRPFEGFAQGEVTPRDAMRWGSNGSPTKQLAKPPSWVPDTGVPCVPLDELSRKDWDKHWDVRTDEEAAELCSTCPVRETCLQDALDHERDADGNPLHFSGRFMVRGGLTPKGRWRLAKSPDDRDDPK